MIRGIGVVLALVACLAVPLPAMADAVDRTPVSEEDANSLRTLELDSAPVVEDIAAGEKSTGAKVGIAFTVLFLVVAATALALTA